jgi:hypothetical protein
MGGSFGFGLLSMGRFRSGLVRFGFKIKFSMINRCLLIDVIPLFDAKSVDVIPPCRHC